MKRSISAVLLATATALMPWPSAQAHTTDSIASRGKEVLQSVVSTAGGIAINAAITEGLKSSVHELRPDRSEHNSFPSRHTSWAFAGATGVASCLYYHNPWWAIGAHAIANGVAFQRVANRRHWGGDVVAGAFTGIASAEISNVLVRMAFGTKAPWQSCTDNDFRPSFALRSEAMYNIGHNHDRNLCTGWGAAINMRVPVDEHFGLSATLHAVTTPMKVNSHFAGVLSGAGLTCGVAVHTPLPCRSLAFTAGVEAGAEKWIGRRELRRAEWGFRGDAELGIEWRLTKRFAFRPTVGYCLCTAAGTYSAIKVSLASAVVF